MSGRVVLVVAAGRAAGAKGAAAALACAGAEADRAGLLIDVGGRPPRPTLVVAAGARELEERLALHLPVLRAASRGQTCHLAVPAGEETFDAVAAAIPLVRDSVAAVHLPAALFRSALEAPGLAPTGVLLRADLRTDRALAALAAGDLLGRRLPVAVLKQPLAWMAARRALFGVLPAEAAGALPPRVVRRLLD